MKSKNDLVAELTQLGVSPEQLVPVNADDPEHLDILAHLDVKRSIEKPQPGDSLSPYGSTWLLHSPQGVPIGFLTLKVIPEGMLGIDSVYVIPEYRGQGYGYALIVVAEIAARLRRLPLVALQPLTSEGQGLMEHAGVRIKSILPAKAAAIKSSAETYWEAIGEKVKCKHRQAQPNRAACEKCLYKHAYPIMRTVLGLIRDERKARHHYGSAA